MKKKIDKLLAEDKKLQQFLTWVNQKSQSVKAHYKPTAVRAFYSALAQDLNPVRLQDLDRARNLDLLRALAQDFNFAQTPAKYFARDLALTQILAQTLTIARARVVAQTFTRNRDRDLAFAQSQNLHFNFSLDQALTHVVYQSRDFSPRLQRLLQQLKDKPPHLEDNLEVYINWWQKNGQVWAEQLRAMMIEHHNIGHDWQFSKEQEDLLQQYYDANKLLVDCLNSDCYVSREVRQEIEDTLLLPVQQ